MILLKVEPGTIAGVHKHFGAAHALGPIGGFDDAGNLAGVLDIDWHCQAAKANGAAGHIGRRSMAAAPAHRGALMLNAARPSAATERRRCYLGRRVRNDCAVPISK